jgi:hypothetical protein
MIRLFFSAEVLVRPSWNCGGRVLILRRIASLTIVTFSAADRPAVSRSTSADARTHIPAADCMMHTAHMADGLI